MKQIIFLLFGCLSIVSCGLKKSLVLEQKELVQKQEKFIQKH